MLLSKNISLFCTVQKSTTNIMGLIIQKLWMIAGYDVIVYNAKTLPIYFTADYVLQNDKLILHSFHF